MDPALGTEPRKGDHSPRNRKDDDEPTTDHNSPMKSPPGASSSAANMPATLHRGNDDTVDTATKPQLNANNNERKRDVSVSESGLSEDA